MQIRYNPSRIEVYYAKKIIISFALIATSTAVFAFSPVSCPTVNDVKNASFQIVPMTDSDSNQPVANQFVAGAQLPSTGTDHVAREWQAMTMIISATDSSQAREKLNLILNSMSAVYPYALKSDELPSMLSDDTVLTCYLESTYKNDANIFAPSNNPKTPIWDFIEKVTKPYTHPLIITTPV